VGALCLGVAACATGPASDVAPHGACPVLTPYTALERDALADLAAKADPEIVRVLNDYRLRRTEIRRCLGEPATLQF
jgi:hypothetical protein